MQKKFQVYKIDALLYDNDWVYNDVQQLGKVYITGEPTKTKFLHALQRNEYLKKTDSSEFYIEDVNETTYSVCETATDMPLFDLVEIE